MRNKVIIFSLLFLVAFYQLNSLYRIASNRIIYQNKNELVKSNDKKEVKLLPVDFGNPYMNHFQFGQSDLQIWAISQDDDGVMVFAHRQGVIIFNGREWEHVKVPAIPIVLKAMPEAELIFLGCDSEYGYLQRNQSGIYEYHQLSDKSSIYSDITDIKVTDRYVYFYSDKFLIRHERANLKVKKTWQVPEKNIQNGIIQIDNDIYISIQNKGFFKFNADGQKKIIPKTQVVSTSQTAFGIPFSKNKVIIGNYGNSLFTFDGKSIAEFKTTAQKYISQSQLTSAIDLSDDLFAISTITGGSIILNKKTGAVVNILDIKSGLPDNEIYSLGKDKDGGLWLSHGFGVTRVNYNLPVKDFNYYQGLEGNILDVVVMNNRTYIATNQGVFYQDSILEKKEVEVAKKRKVKKEVDDKQIQNTIIVNEIKESKKEEPKVENEEIKPVVTEKKNLWQRLKERKEEKKKKKNNTAETTTNLKKEEKELPKEPIIEEPKSNENVLIKPETDIDPKKSTKSKIKAESSIVWSVNYVFKKISDINGKCRQLVKYENLLLVATNNGLYEVTDKTSKIILKKNYINIILPSKTPGTFYIGTDKGITAIKYEKGKWVEYNNIQPKGFNDPVFTIAEDRDQNLWVGNDIEVYYFVVGKDFVTNSYTMHDFGNEFPEKFSIAQIENSIFFLSSKQIYKYNTTSNQIELNNQLIENKLSYLKYVASQKGITWLQNENEWLCISENFKPGKYQLAFLNLFENIQNIYVDEKNNLWVVDGKNSLYKILATANLSLDKEKQNVFIQRIKTDKGNNIPLNKIKIPVEISSLTITISAPNYLKPSGTLYQYYIKGIMDDWSEWKPNQEFDYFVQPGDYKLQVRAKNVLGEVCESVEYRLSVKTPIYKQEWFYLVSALFVIFILGVINFLLQKKREKKLQRYNKILEAKVEERTNEIVVQKEQIELKNREITDSLNYASQIQTAILPPVSLLKNTMSDFFILNRPKDIVSGDFYWINNRNGQLVVCAADCTGHGVPGAFLSLLGVTFLNEITSKIESLRANLILEMLRERVIESLNQGNFDKKRLDGIDLSLAVIDFSKMELQFAGANNSMYLVRNGYLSEFKGNRMPIGLHAHKDKPFTNHDIEIKKGDMIYLFSDGYIDQFGGDYGRKFLSRNFKVLLTEIFDQPMKDQREILLDLHATWKGTYEQIDDILVVGLKV